MLPSILSGDGGLFRHPTVADFPIIGDKDYLYLDESTQFLYEWDGSEYLPVASDTASIPVDTFLQKAKQAGVLPLSSVIGNVPKFSVVGGLEDSGLPFTALSTIDGEVDTYANLPSMPDSSYDGKVYIVKRKTGLWPADKPAGLWISDGTVWSVAPMTAGALTYSDIVNNLSSTSTSSVLSAAMGKQLNDSLADEIATRLSEDNSLDSRLDTIESDQTVIGSVANSIKQSKDYTDNTATTLQNNIDGKITTTLASGKILVGNSSNLAAPQTPSGELSIDNAGVYTLSGSAILAKILQGLVDASSVAKLTTTNTLLDIGKFYNKLIQDYFTTFNAANKLVQLDGSSTPKLPAVDGSLVVNMVKSQVGLGNVDNTSDLNKPVSTSQQSALDLKVDKISGKGLSANDLTDILKSGYDDAVIKSHTHANKSILDAIQEALTSVLKTAYDSVVSWVSTNGTNLINHLSNTSNPHSVTKIQVGLGNVANIDSTNLSNDTIQGTFTPSNTAIASADDGKTAFQKTQGQINNKLDKAQNLSDVNSRQTSLDTLTAVSAATNEHVLTKDTSTGNAVWKASQGTSAIWGAISGTLSNQSDLQAAINLKETASNKDATGGYAGLTLFKINFKNALNTFTSFFTNANTAARTYTFQDRDGTIADNTDISNRQPLDATLTALAGLSTATGLVVQTGTDTFTKRQITGTTNYVNVTNGGGVGNDINIGMSIGGNAPSGNIVDQNTAQTLTNKTLTDSTTYFQDNADNTKKLQFELSGITTNTTRTLKVPDISAGTGSKLLVVQDSLNLNLYGANGNNVIDTNVIPEGGTNKYYTDARVQTYVQGTALTYSQIQSFSKSIAAFAGIGIQAQSIVGAFDIDATAYNTPGVYCNQSGQTISNVPSGMPTPLAVILWSFTDDINNNGGATSIVQYLYSCSSDTPYVHIRSKYSNHAKSAWVQISPSANSGVPVGTLIEYSANSVPTGFLLANGASVSRTTYAAIFAVIGTTFGAGNGSTTFQVPDARGLFLRGYGTNSNGWASGSFGTKIGDSFASHTHSVTDPGHTHVSAAGQGFWYWITGGTARIGTFSGGYPAEAYSNLTTNTTGISIGSTGGSETAPKHIAVSICIKY